MAIEEFCEKDEEQVKDLLVELQRYVIEIDKYNLNILAPQYREKYFKYMQQDCKKNNGKIFVARKNDDVVGFIAGYVQKYDKRDKLDYSCPKKAIVAELIVSKDCRSEGIGNILLEALEGYFKSISCKYIQIDVFAYNEKAKAFYVKNNYEERMITMFKSIED